MQPIKMIKVKDIQVKSKLYAFDDDALHAKIYGYESTRHGNFISDTVKDSFVKLPFETPTGTRGANIYTYGNTNSYIRAINYYGYNNEDGLFTYFYNVRTGETERTL